MSIPSQPKRLLLNASLLRVSACLRKVNFIHNLGLYQSHSTYKMDYGTAGHKALAQWYLGERDQQKLLTLAVTHYMLTCTQASEKDFRTPEHLIKVLGKYFQVYKNDSFKVEHIDGKPLVEIPFSYPYKIVNGVEVILCGTIDLVGRWFQELVFMDHKFTSSYQHDSYLKSKELDVQPMMYSWNLRRILGLDFYPPCLINGVFIKKNPVGEERKGNFDGVTFQRSKTPITFSDERMKLFVEYMDHTIDRITSAMNNDNTEYPPDFSQCNTSFYPCDFFEICRCPSKFQEQYRDTHYQRREYNPLRFQE